MDDWTHRLYRDFAPDLYRIARSRLGDEALAQDMVQEVFLRLLERRNKLKHHPNPQGWLVKTLDHCILHAVDKRLRETPLTEEGMLPAPAGRGTLDEVLPAQLAEEDKQLLKWFYEDRLSYRELSARLGVPPGTCGTWLYRARARCRKLLEEGGMES